MAARLCRVTITDTLDVARTMEVHASSLLEAVAEGWLAIRGGDLAIPDGFKPVKVVVIEAHTEYEVRLKDFVRWLDGRANNPKEVTRRKKVRSRLQLRRPGSAERCYRTSPPAQTLSSPRFSSCP